MEKINKTPNFTKAVSEILANLNPGLQACPQCGDGFEIYAEDIEFYNIFQTPPPKLCPACRLQRRLGFRVNMLPIFHKRKCDAPGHEEEIFSIYPQEAGIKIYDEEYYISDQWDGLNFERDYDANADFFRQLSRLLSEVPRQSLNRDPKGVNSDYVISGIAPKNCYYVTTPFHSEDCYYGRLAYLSRNSLDFVNLDNSENCFSTAFLYKCYNCDYCYSSSNCMDSRFLFDCHNCSNCFGSVNLRNKKYYFFNRRLSSEQYKNEISKLNLGKYSELQKIKERFHAVASESLRKNLDNIQTEDSLGDNLKSCRKCFYCFEIFKEGENLRYVISAEKISDSGDVYGSSGSSKIYESTGIGGGSIIKFSSVIRGGVENEYCFELRNCEYCFGCVGLRDKKYCILNKQYMPEDYWTKVDEIKTKMLAKREYGEFLPINASSLSYDDSAAYMDFPLTKQEVLAKGWTWWNEKGDKLDLSGHQVVEAQNLPDDIRDAKDDILNKVIMGEDGKPFRLTPFELTFYRRKGVSLPRCHPLARIKELFKWRRPYKIYEYPCAKCGKMMKTSLAPEKGFKIYCESCYQSKII